MGLKNSIFPYGWNFARRRLMGPMMNAGGMMRFSLQVGHRLGDLALADLKTKPHSRQVAGLMRRTSSLVLRVLAMWSISRQTVASGMPRSSEISRAVNGSPVDCNLSMIRFLLDIIPSSAWFQYLRATCHGWLNSSIIGEVARLGFEFPKNLRPGSLRGLGLSPGPLTVQRPECLTATLGGEHRPPPPGFPGWVIGHPNADKYLINQELEINIYQWP